MVGVLGSGSNAFPHLSFPLGKWLAARGYDLINGGGGGVMAETARGFASVIDRTGFVLGILPSQNPCDEPALRRDYRAPSNYPNPYVDFCIRTHLNLSGERGMDPASRNHIIVLTADILIALPGSAGTRSEIKLALDYGKPLGILNVDGAWNEFSSSNATMANSLEGIFEFVQAHTKN